MAHQFLFFTEKIDLKNKTLLLENEEFNHLFKVLRKNKNLPFQVTDGKGRTFIAKAKELYKKSCEAEILETLVDESENENKITLAVGILHGNRFDFLVEKCSELGIKKIIPIKSQDVKEKVRLERWKKISVSALKQSGGNWLTEVVEPVSFAQALKLSASFTQKLIAHEEFAESPKENLSKDSETLILIGSEKGFSEEEVEMSLARNFQSLSLGKRRLRTETASIVACGLFLLVNRKGSN